MDSTLETTYLPTGMEPDNTLALILIALAVVAAFSFVATIVSAAMQLENAPYIFLPITLLSGVLLLAVGLNATIKAQEENAANLTQNIHTAYDVDDVKIDPNDAITEDGTVMWKATVYEGDTAYEVEVRQDEKTFEPTLISYESDAHIRELKK